MTDYHVIAEGLKLPSQILIDGQWRDALYGATFATIDPSTGRELAHLPACDAGDVDATVASARAAFKSGVWSDLHPTARKAVLVKLAALIEDNLTELAVMEVIDAGKPITDCLEIDVPETASCIRWHAEAQDKLYDQIAPSAPDAVEMIMREPVGVVAAVLLWNFPLMMMA